MTKSQETLYQEAVDILSHISLETRDQKKSHPRDYIVATHGPALLKAVIADPTILNNIGWYRINCSHLGKEHNLEIFAEYLRAIHAFVPILIDLQGPKPRIHEMDEELQDKMILRIDDTFDVSYAPDNSPERFCTERRLRVCFPEIVNVMEIGDSVIFDDGKMTAKVVRKQAEKATLQCIEIRENTPKYILKGRKGICVRNRPLGINCLTQYDRKSISFAKVLLGFEFVDTIMVSYFSTLNDIQHFIEVLRDEYGFIGNLGGKFETPHSVVNAEKIFSHGTLNLAMLGRGDLRVEMDPRALANMYDIQTHFFTACRKYRVKSICATGFLESMIVPDGKVTPEEILDMQTALITGAGHLMLSGETSYGAQASACVQLETKTQRQVQKEIASGENRLKSIPKNTLRELLFIE